MKLSLNWKEELCTGCHICEMACSTFHEGVINITKSRLRIRGEESNAAMEATLCKLSGECAQVCPVEGAIYKNKAGAYVIDPDTCTNCGLCVPACPHQAIFTSPELASPVICDLCAQCVKACPTDALWLKRE